MDNSLTHSIVTHTHTQLSHTQLCHKRNFVTHDSHAQPCRTHNSGAWPFGSTVAPWSFAWQVRHFVGIVLYYWIVFHCVVLSCVVLYGLHGMYLCLYGCVCVCLYVCLYVCMYACKYVGIVLEISYSNLICEFVRKSGVV